MIKFNKFAVVDGSIKARVHYSLDNRVDARKCVTIYSKDYTGELGKLFSGNEYTNDTDYQTDYFDKGRVVLFSDHPLYAQARASVEKHLDDERIKRTVKFLNAEQAAISAEVVLPSGRAVTVFATGEVK
jgi:hypothetical protein